MINSLVLFVLVAMSISAAIGRTFDVRASRVGRLSGITMALLAMLTSTAVAFTLVFIFNSKKVLPELKSSYNSQEFKYILLSTLFYLPSFLAIYWILAREKAHIVAIFITSLMVTFHVIFSIVILKETVTPMTWIGIVIVIAGLFLIATNNNDVAKN